MEFRYWSLLAYFMSFEYEFIFDVHKNELKTFYRFDKRCVVEILILLG